MLLCPTYNYIKFNNLKDIVPDEINCNNIKNYVTRLTKEQRICKNYDSQECLEKIYKWLYKKCKKINKYNNMKNMFQSYEGAGHGGGTIQKGKDSINFEMYFMRHQDPGRLDLFSVIPYFLGLSKSELTYAVYVKYN